MTNVYEATDLTRWRLTTNDGAQVWIYLNDQQINHYRPQTAYEKYFLGMDTSNLNLLDPKPVKSPFDAAQNAFQFLKRIQTPEGFWASEYGGPMFLLPGLIIALYAVGKPLAKEYQTEIIRYILFHLNEEDGWGLHVEHHATCYGTVMNYTALRLLGVEKENPDLVNVRKTIRKLGGAVCIPTWGKVLLSCVGLYEWEGMHPLLAEIWALPNFMPLHPGKMWVHSRNVFASMSYLYCVKFRMKENNLIKAIRQEIYIESYEKIDWMKARNSFCEVDIIAPHTLPMKLANKLFGFYEDYVVPNYAGYRNIGIKAVFDQIMMEDENTKYLDIGPVNKALNIMCVYHALGTESKEFKNHIERVLDFLWLGKTGMMMNGTNGLQLWDTAFIVQAAVECGFHKNKENYESIEKAYTFVDKMQIRHNSLHYGNDYRHQTRGAWPFSTRDQSYVVSDCTSEGLKAILCLKDSSFIQNKVSYERMCDAVDILLSMQNKNGGVASYELIRGGYYYEWFNAAEVFCDIMIEYCYPECTTAFLLALESFSHIYPKYRPKEIQQAKTKAVKFIKSTQLKDGSWYGSWGICFTYATFFAVESLTTFGESYENSNELKKACDFLVSKQKEDGGWGESYKSCVNKEYSQNKSSQVVNTSWALLSLMAAKYPHLETIKKGIRNIMKKQNKNGSWNQESIEGVFNRNCMISYPNYKLFFPMWALGRYTNLIKSAISP